MKMSAAELKNFIAKTGAKVTTSRSVAECLAGRSGSSGDSLTLRLPLPPPACSPNARTHWAAKARAVKSLRTAAQAAAVGAMLTFENPIIDAVFWFRTKKTRDRDNAIASCKAILDGLTDAKLWRDDHLVRWGDVALMVDKDDPRLILTIREITL